MAALQGSALSREGDSVFFLKKSGFGLGPVADKFFVWDHVKLASSAPNLEIWRFGCLPRLSYVPGMRSCPVRGARPV